MTVLSAGAVYGWLRAFHVAAVLTWVGGLFAVAAFLALLPALAADPASRARAARAVRTWDRRIATPAMLGVWALGLTLVQRGHWLAPGAQATRGVPVGWLRVKLALVVGLSALHGVQAGTLRRLAAGDEPGARPLARVAPFLVLGAVVAIALLVVAKPF